MAQRDPDSITRTQPFTAKIVKSKIDGRAEMVIGSKRWFQHQINKFRDGEIVTLEVHNRAPKRTDQQNRYYWGVYLPIIARETGESDLEALHELFKGKFLAEGIVEVFGHKVRKKRSTTDLGVGDFCQYILDIEAMTGVAAPPTENWQLAPLREGVKEKEKHADNEVAGDNSRKGKVRSKPKARSPRKGAKAAGKPDRGTPKRGSAKRAVRAPKPASEPQDTERGGAGNSADAADNG